MIKIFDIILPNLKPRPEDKNMAKNKQIRMAKNKQIRLQIFDSVIAYKKQFINYIGKRNTLKMIKFYISWEKKSEWKMNVKDREKKIVFV